MASQTLTTTGAARVNLLPPEIAERERVRRLQSGLGIAVLASAAVVGLLYALQVAKVNDAQDELDSATAQNVALRQQRSELQTVVDTYAAVASKEAVLRSALANDIAWSSYLNDLMLTIPDNLWLTSMGATQSGGDGSAASVATVPGAPASLGSVAFTGIAFDHDDVAAWLEVLARQKGYANPYFTSSTETKLGTRVVYAFTSSVTITEQALSRRAERLLGS